MQNLIRFRPTHSPYFTMEKLDLLAAFQAWVDAPGENLQFTREWLRQGFLMLPALYERAETIEMQDHARQMLAMCQRIEQEQFNGQTAS
jgi:hypothetical protein